MAFDFDEKRHAAAAADFGHFTELFRVGGFADDAGIEFLAADFEPFEHRLGAVEGDAFLILSDEEGN